MSDRTELHKTLRLTIAVAAAAVLVPTGVNAAVDAFKLQDGDGQSKAQVDKGSVRIGDGDGALTVDGDVGIANRVRTSVAQILLNGDCSNQPVNSSHSQSGVLPEGTVVTEIVMTQDWNGVAQSTLVVKKPSIPEFSATNDNATQQRGGRFMAIQTGLSTGYADLNETVSFGDGVELDEAWHFFCTGQIGSTDGTGLWSVYGYEA
jgi:hypothetical protein